MAKRSEQNDRSVALAYYEPRRYGVARADTVLVSGHRFERIAGWRCVCGMRWPRGLLAREIPPCTRGVPS